MNVAARNELLEALTEISRLSPEMRLGQLVCWLTDMTEHKYTTSPVADIEDDELLPAAKSHLEELRKRMLISNAPVATTPLTASSNTQLPPAAQPV